MNSRESIRGGRPHTTRPHRLVALVPLLPAVFGCDAPTGGPPSSPAPLAGVEGGPSAPGRTGPIGPPGAGADDAKTGPGAADADAFERLFNEANGHLRLKRYDRAIDCLDRALDVRPKDRRTLDLLAEALQSEAYRLSQCHRWDDAAPLFIRAAKVVRKLREVAGDLDRQETALLRMAFYNEACAYARTGREEEALQSLEEALEEGFLSLENPGGPDARETLLTDPDLDPIRKRPEFERLKERFLPGPRPPADPGRS